MSHTLRRWMIHRDPIPLWHNNTAGCDKGILQRLTCFYRRTGLSTHVKVGIGIPSHNFVALIVDQGISTARLAPVFSSKKRTDPVRYRLSSFDEPIVIYQLMLKSHLLPPCAYFMALLFHRWYPSIIHTYSRPILYTCCC